MKTPIYHPAARKFLSYSLMLTNVAASSLLVACGGSAMPPTQVTQAVSERTSLHAGAPAQVAPTPAPPGAAGAAPGSIARVSTQAAAPSSPDPAKGATKSDTSAPAFLIMYTGSLSMMVDDGKVASAIDQIVDLAEGAGGHLAGRTDTSVTLKVPSGRFRAVLSDAERVGTITHRSVVAEDVTEEYKDAEVRLANLRATRARLQDFMAKTTSVSDMLTIEQQLERVSMDIDRIEGRMRFLRERTAFSTITVNLSVKPREMVAKVDVPPPPPPPAPVVAIELPAKWLDQLGSDRLMQVKK